MKNDPFTYRPVRLVGGNFEACRDSEADFFGIYINDAKGLPRWLEDAGSRAEAIGAIEERIIPQFEDDWREQIALFATHVEPLRVSNRVAEQMNGMAGVYSYLVNQARAFVVHHMIQAAGVPDYWDGADWYLQSDEWMAEKILPFLYGLEDAA